MTRLTAAVRGVSMLAVLLAACEAPTADPRRDAAAAAAAEAPAAARTSAGANGVQDAAPREPAAVVGVELPLVAVEGRLLTQVHVADAGTYWFIIDTAAGRSLISAALRRQLDISRSDTRLSTVNGATGRTVMEFVRLPALRVGAATHANRWVIVADIPDFRRYGTRDVHGILGVDVLSEYDVAFDVRSGTLRLHPRDGSAGKRLAAAAEGIPFHSRVSDGFVQFTALLHGDSVHALLDTGARTGAMNWQAAALAGVTADSEDVRADARGALGMNGRRVGAHRYTFDRLCLGERCLPPTELRIMDLPMFDAIGARDAPAVLFGADVLHDCALLLSYSTKRLHFCE